MDYHIWIHSYYIVLDIPGRSLRPVHRQTTARDRDTGECRLSTCPSYCIHSRSLFRPRDRCAIPKRVTARRAPSRLSLSIGCHLVICSRRASRACSRRGNARQDRLKVQRGSRGRRAKIRACCSLRNIGELWIAAIASAPSGLSFPRSFFYRSISSRGGGEERGERKSIGIRADKMNSEADAINRLISV